MRYFVHSLFRLSLLVVAGSVIGSLLGCGSGSPKAAVVEPAKNMYVIQNSSTNGVETDTVLAISATATTGTATPSATLQVPSELLAFALAVGPDGEIYVGGPTSQTTGEVLVFAPGATGAATPTATLTGGMGTFMIPFYMTVSSKGQLVVFSTDGTIETFAKGATTSAAPTQYLTYPSTTDDYFAGIGVDDAGEIFVTDEKAGKIEVFAAGANGADAPVRSITATSAGSFTDVYALSVNGAGDVTVVNYNQADDPFMDDARPTPLQGTRLQRFVRHGAGSKAARPMDTPQIPTSIMTFAAGTSGTATPTRTLSGALTAINEPEGVATDALGNLYYEDYENGALTLMKFLPTATGNVAPSASITSTAFSTSYFGSIAAY